MNLEESNRNNTQLVLNILNQQNKTKMNELKYDIERIKNEKYFGYSIQMIDSKSDIFELFDSITGKGFNNMSSWYLCNGRYGTPNLNNKNNDYINILFICQINF